MPTTINVGLQKKLGLPDFGSVGASCNIQFEASHDLLDDLDAFHEKVRRTFVAARQAVQDQLARELNVPASDDNSMPPVASNGKGAGHAPSNGNGSNGNGHRHSTNGHSASEKQLGYARQLARSIQGLGVRRLETLAATMFSKPLAALTSMDASGLIDTLKSIKEGKIDLASVLEGHAA